MAKKEYERGVCPECGSKLQGTRVFICNKCPAIIIERLNTIGNLFGMSAYYCPAKHYPPKQKPKRKTK